MRKGKSLKEILDEMGDGGRPARFLKEVATDPTMPETLRRDAVKTLRQYGFHVEETR